MTELTDTVGETVAAVQRARAALACELELHEAWRALRQLDERESRGETIDGVDAGKLRQYLEGELDRARPGWWLWRSMGAAITPISQWAVTGPLPVATQTTAVGAGPNAGAATGVAEAEVGKIRVKVKAGTSAFETGVTLATLATTVQDMAAVTGADVRPADGAAMVTVTALQPVPPAAAVTPPPPQVPVLTKPVLTQPPPPAPDLSRIRLIDRIHIVPPASDSAHADRFGGALPWASFGSPPPAPASESNRSAPQPSLPEPRREKPFQTPSSPATVSQTAAPPAARLGTGLPTAATPGPPAPSTVRPSPPKPVALPVRAVAGEAVTLPVATAAVMPDDVPPVADGAPTDAPPSAPPIRQGFAAGLAPVERPATRVEAPSPEARAAAPASAPSLVGGDRLARLEADLDDIVGRPLKVPAPGRSAAGRGRPAVVDADDGGLDVGEAEVEILPRRPDPEVMAPVSPRPWLAARPSVALSIRLKEGERSAEFDSDDYAAYHDDVGEADVEIIRGRDDSTPAEAGGEHRDDTHQPAGIARRFLKGFSRE